MNKITFIIVAISLCFITACTSKNNNEKDLYKESYSLYRIFVDDKYGFMDENGKIVIEPQFDYVYSYFSEGVCFAEVGDRKGLIDSTGRFTMEFGDSVNYVSNFVKGLSCINCGWHKNGIINKEGLLIIPANHNELKVNEDNDSIYIVVKGWDHPIISDWYFPPDWYILNKKGDTIGQSYHEILVGFRNGLCAVRLFDKWGYIDVNGNFAIDTIYDFVKVFSKDGFARVRKGKEHFFIDKSGNKLFSADSTITGFTCNRAAVVLDGEKCFIDTKGNKIFSVDADEIYSFTKEDNMATIIKNGKASKIDTLGNIVLSTDYDYIGAFIDGVAPAIKNKKWGFIDINGKEIINTINDEYIYDFHKKGSKLRAVINEVNDIRYWSYYDLKGSLIWKDVPSEKKELPIFPERKDYIEYFDARMAELDPIEGIYYVTRKNYYQDRDNPNSIGLNDSKSTFYAVVKDDNNGDFIVRLVDESSRFWKNKFVSIGESNIYAIVSNNDIDNAGKYSSEGRVLLDDPTRFEFRLEQGHNDWYNFFVTYEFIKDYPPSSEYEKVRKAEWSGSGFAIADGFVVTNYHVTSGAKSIRIKGINGDINMSYKGYVVASDKEHDISIIKIIDKNFESLGSIPYNIGNEVVNVGDDVFVLGYPMTATMGDEIKLTEGIISAASGFKGDKSMYQISAAVQPGNSGGPLFNSDGTIIGIICAKHSEAENANYAIKISYLYSLVTQNNIGFNISNNNKLKTMKLSNQVEKIKNYVYLIECNSY